MGELTFRVGAGPYDIFADSVRVRVNGKRLRPGVDFVVRDGVLEIAEEAAPIPRPFIRRILVEFAPPIPGRPVYHVLRRWTDSRMNAPRLRRALHAKEDCGALKHGHVHISVSDEWAERAVQSGRWWFCKRCCRSAGSGQG